MASEALGYLDYVKDAFHRKVVIPLLGPMPLNKMALGVFSVLGLANPGFWLLGAAGELAYLGFVAGSGRYQKLVQGERLLAAQEVWEGRIHSAVERLSSASQERYRRLLAQSRRIVGISDTLDADSLGDMKDLKARNLNQLLGIFLRLLASREVIQQNIQSLDRDQLEREISTAESRLAEIDREKDTALARSLEGTLEIQRKRLDNLERAGASYEVIDAELLRIEQQVELIREETAVSRSPEALSDRLDAVTSHMSETSRWMDDNRELFGALGMEETDDLGELPRLPDPVAEGS